MPYRLAVRKLIKGRRALRELYLVSLASFALSLVGYVLYELYYPSDVVLVEAFVWLLEGISFAGLALAFHVASSKALAYRARFEILRLEALATLFASILASVVVVLVVWRSLSHHGGEPTPLALSLYPLASAAASLILERHLHRTMHAYEVRLASVRAVASKLGYDVVFEVAGGLAIVASNTLHNPLVERALVVSVGAYILYGIAMIAYEALAYLVWVGPRGVVERIRGRINEVLRATTRYPARRVKVEMYGTFGEAEVWLEAPGDMSLAEASRESVAIARRLVHSIPELLRAVVIMVPRQPARPREARREQPRAPRGRGGRARRPQTRRARRYAKRREAAGAGRPAPTPRAGERAQPPASGSRVEGGTNGSTRAGGQGGAGAGGR